MLDTSNKIIKKGILTAIVGLFIIALLFISIIYIKILNDKTFIYGEIVNKYQNGQNNSTYHLVVKNCKDTNEENIDVTIDKDQYKQYNLKDTVYIDYSLFKEVEEIKPYYLIC